MEVMAMQYKLLSKIRREGMLGIERDIDILKKALCFKSILLY